MNGEARTMFWIVVLSLERTTTVLDDRMEEEKKKQNADRFCRPFILTCDDEANPIVVSALQYVTFRLS
jgi:hypothetical protein